MGYEEEEKEEGGQIATTLYTTAAVDSYSGLDDSYHPALLNPTPDMLESRLATERSEGLDTDLDAVARLGLVTGMELNAAYRMVVDCILRTLVCPDNTKQMLEETIMRFPKYKPLDPVKREVIYYALWLLPEVQRMFCAGDSGGGVQHELIDEETMKIFVTEGLEKAKDNLSKCIETPHVFVDRVLEMVESGGVRGYVQRSLHA